MFRLGHAQEFALGWSIHPVVISNWFISNCPSQISQIFPFYSKVAGQVLEIHNQIKSAIGDFLGNFQVIFIVAILQRTNEDLFVTTVC